MAVTGTYTARDIITDALRKIGVVAGDEALTADEALSGLRALNRMLKAWQNRGFSLWLQARQTLTLTTAASYTLSPARPLRILSARYVRAGIETPMQEMMRDEYDSLPVKLSQGTPTAFYYERQREGGTFYVWPVPAVGGDTVAISYEREIEDADDLDAAPDAPMEFADALVYGLAARLADDYTVAAPNVVARAEEEFQFALASDREGSVWFS